MNIERISHTRKKELIAFRMKNDIGHVTKTFIIYKTQSEYRISVDQIQNGQQIDLTVSKFEFPTPMNIRDEVFKRSPLYDKSISKNVSSKTPHRIIYKNGF